MSTKIKYSFDVGDYVSSISVREAFERGVSTIFDEYGSKFFTEAELKGNIAEFEFCNGDENFSIVIQSKKGSGVN